MIAITNLCIDQGAFSLRNIGFRVESGQYAVMMGKTGCGKTTLLEVICGLRSPTSGKIELMHQDVTRWKAAERGIGYVPQDRALFPTMTVEDHLAFALQIRSWKKNDIRRRVEELAALLGLEHLLRRKPHGLSGGESQRVALGRALAFHPNILLLDEPLSALDENTREEMLALLTTVRKQVGVTALHITHNVTEAQRLADKTLVFMNGRVE